MKTIVKAAKVDNKDMILELKDVVSSDALICCVETALRTKNIDMAEFMLSVLSPSDTDNDIEQLIQAACMSGSFEVVKWAYERFDPLLSIGPFRIFYYKCTLGDFVKLEEFVKEQENILSLLSLLSSYTRAGNGEVIASLDLGLIKLLSEKKEEEFDIELVIQSAAKFGRRDVALEKRWR